MIEAYKKMIEKKKDEAHFKGYLEAKEVIEWGRILEDADNNLIEDIDIDPEQGISIDGESLEDYLRKTARSRIVATRRYADENQEVISTKTIEYNERWEAYDQSIQNLETFMKKHPILAKVIPKKVIFGWFSPQYDPLPIKINEHTLTLLKLKEGDPDYTNMLRNIAEEIGEELDEEELLGDLNDVF